MRRRSFLAVAGWLVTAAVATLIGVAAIRWVGESIAGTPGGVLSQEEVERALAAPAPTTANAASTSPTGSAPHGERRAFATDGGTAVAECGPDGVWLVSWVPAQGYRVSDVDRGPDDDVEVAFTGPAGEFELKVRCVGREPVAVEDDD